MPYEGRIAIDEESEIPISINDLDRADWIGRIERVRPAELPDRDVRVMLLEGERAGETATARYAIGHPDRSVLYLNGREPFTKVDAGGD